MLLQSRYKISGAQHFIWGKKINLQDNEPGGKTSFRMEGCAQGLVLTQRNMATRKWPSKIQGGF